MDRVIILPAMSTFDYQGFLQIGEESPVDDSTDRYILDGKTPVRWPNLLQWAYWFDP